MIGEHEEDAAAELAAQQAMCDEQNARLLAEHGEPFQRQMDTLAFWNDMVAGKAKRAAERMAIRIIGEAARAAGLPVVVVCMPTGHQSAVFVAGERRFARKVRVETDGALAILCRADLLERTAPNEWTASEDVDLLALAARTAAAREAGA